MQARIIILTITAILILTGCRNPSAPETNNNTDEEIDTMTWTTPRTDWKSDQQEPISDTDLNRIESNTEYLYNTATSAKYWSQLMHVSGCVGGDAIRTIDAGSIVVVQSIYVAVKKRPASGLGTGLNIRYIGYSINSDFRLRVQVEGETGYYQSVNNQDYYDASNEGPINSSLFANYTDSVVYKKLLVSVVNIAEEARQLSPSAGWSFQLSGLVTNE